MDNWKDLPGDRRLMKAKHYSVIIPNSPPPVVPLDCPVCQQLMKDHDDVLSFRRNSCCIECENMWAIPNSDKWSSGWRPEPQTIINEINRRNDYPSFIYQVK